MPATPSTAPITIRADRGMVTEIDALAEAMSRSRNYVVVQALRQYLETNAWQIERIKAGAAAVREDRVRDADAVFTEIADKHGWSR